MNILICTTVFCSQFCLSPIFRDVLNNCMLFKDFNSLRTRESKETRGLDLYYHASPCQNAGEKPISAHLPHLARELLRRYVAHVAKLKLIYK